MKTGSLLALYIALTHGEGVSSGGRGRGRESKGEGERESKGERERERAWPTEKRQERKVLRGHKDTNAILCKSL